MNQEEQQFLENYNAEQYWKPSVTADIAVFAIQREAGATYRLDPKKKLCLLLIKRGAPPFKDCWALPGGFLRETETMTECAARELYEETGAEATVLRHIGVFSGLKRDPRTRVISNAFLSVLSEEKLENMKIAAGDDAAYAGWFEIQFTQGKKGEYLLTLQHDDIKIYSSMKKIKNKYGMTEFKILKNGGFAFDHAEIIASAITHLRYETKHFELIFDFLPEKFTLSDLQEIEERVSGKTLLASNYRRKAENFLTQTGEMTNGFGHRPARLFTRKK